MKMVTLKTWDKIWLSKQINFVQLTILLNRVEVGWCFTKKLTTAIFVLSFLFSSFPNTSHHPNFLSLRSSDKWGKVPDYSQTSNGTFQNSLKIHTLLAWLMAIFRPNPCVLGNHPTRPMYTQLTTFECMKDNLCSSYGQKLLPCSFCTLKLLVLQQYCPDSPTFLLLET